MYQIKPPHRLCFCFFLLILLGCTNQYEQPEKIVFILAGQSNMSGRAKTSNIPDALRPLLILPQNAKLYKQRFRGKEYFGPELSLIHEISRIRSDKECIFIKWTIGRTSLLKWDPDWIPERARITKDERRGPVYQKFIEFVQKKTFGKDVRFEAMFWMQGERDARYPEAGRMYMQNFEKLIRQIRRDLNTPDLPVFCGQINPPYAKFPAVKLVRDAQALTAKQIHNVKMISTDGLEKRGDQIHYNFAGQIELGKRFAKAYSEMIERVIADKK